MKLSQFKGLKQFIEDHKQEIMEAGVGVTVSGSALAMHAMSFCAQTESDQLNTSFTMLGGMINGFAGLIPDIVNLVIALIPLIFIGAFVGCIVIVIYMIPKMIKIEVPKM